MPVCSEGALVSVKVFHVETCDLAGERIQNC